ncbi:MAG: pilus assembly protein TadG-related protein [Chloroflexota bacterium]|jgi:hypothetical protein
MLFREPERGSSLAWTAIFLAVVILPLMTLIGDGVRLYYVRSRIFQAADAACEDVSWSVASRTAWQWMKDDRYDSNWKLVKQAQTTFSQMLAETGAVKYTPSITLSLDIENARAECQAQARVPLMTMPQEVTIRVTAYSKMRFAQP